MSKLITRNIFIDTCIFHQKNYGFGHYVFNKIVDLASNEYISVFLTEVTFREIISNIEQQIESTKSYLNQIQKKGNILRNIPQFEVIFNKRFINSVFDTIKQQFLDFLKKSQAQILPIKDIDSQEIIRRYFEQKAPFSSKKKNEFPDAFTLAALESWCKRNQQKMYIISEDKDYKNYCDESDVLYHLDSVEQFLNLLTQPDESRYEFILNLFESNHEILEEALKENFIDQGFIFSNIDVDDVENVEIFYVEFESDPNVIELGDRFAVLTCETRFTFEAEVSVLDPDDSIYDSEEGTYIYHEYEYKKFESDVLIPVQVTLEFNLEDKSDIAIQNVVINEGRPIYVELDYEDLYDAD
jgi:hypothetical protein